MSQQSEAQEQGVLRVTVAMEAAGYDPESIRDLLADVMHYCEDEKIDFWIELQSAQMHFSDEHAAYIRSRRKVLNESTRHS